MAVRKYYPCYLCNSLFLYFFYQFLNFSVLSKRQTEMNIVKSAFLDFVQVGSFGNIEV
jgi:hypothetical protein